MGTGLRLGSVVLAIALAFLIVSSAVPLGAGLSGEERDTAVLNVSIDSAEPVVGQRCKVTITAANQGIPRVVFRVIFLVNGVQQSSKYLSLNSGEIGSVSFDWTPRAAGTYELEGEVKPVLSNEDPTNNLASITVEVVDELPTEFEENPEPTVLPNKLAEVTWRVREHFRIRPLIDIGIKSISAEPREPLPSEKVRVAITVKNYGKLPVWDIPVKLLVDGTRVGPIQYIDNLFPQKILPKDELEEIWAEFKDEFPEQIKPWMMKVIRGPTEATLTFEWTPENYGTYSLIGVAGPAKKEFQNQVNNFASIVVSMPLLKTEYIENQAITTIKIADAAITAAKLELDPKSLYKISGGHLWIEPASPGAGTTAESFLKVIAQAHPGIFLKITPTPVEYKVDLSQPFNLYFNWEGLTKITFRPEGSIDYAGGLYQAGVRGIPENDIRENTITQRSLAPYVWENIRLGVTAYEALPKLQSRLSSAEESIESLQSRVGNLQRGLQDAINTIRCVEQDIETLETRLSSAEESIEHLEVRAGKEPTFIVATDGTGDFLEIQPALEALEEYYPSGGLIFVKQGTYEVSETIEIKQDNVSLIGAGASTVIRWVGGSHRSSQMSLPELLVEIESGSSSQVVLQASDCSRITIANLSVNGSMEAEGINLIRVTQGRVEGCSVMNSVIGIGIGLGGHNEIKNNIVENNRWGIVILASHHNIVSNDESKWNQEDGIALAWRADNNFMTSNSLFNNSGYGLRIYDSTCTGNKIGVNYYWGNLLGAIRDEGIDTERITSEDIQDEAINIPKLLIAEVWWRMPRGGDAWGHRENHIPLFFGRDSDVWGEKWDLSDFAVRLGSKGYWEVLNRLPWPYGDRPIRMLELRKYERRSLESKFFLTYDVGTGRIVNVAITDIPRVFENLEDCPEGQRLYFLDEHPERYSIFDNPEDYIFDLGKGEIRKRTPQEKDALEEELKKLER